MAGKIVSTTNTKKVHVETEVEEEEREEPAVDPEDEEDEEGEDEYEIDGFIVDDVDEDEQQEEDSTSDDERKKMKKRRKKRESEKKYVLDEEDYELLQDNMYITGPKVEIKKFKRLKKATADADQGQSNFDEEKDQPQDREEDEMADFIVDDQEEVIDDEPTRRKTKKKSRVVSSSAIQEARDIFGDVDELLRQRKLVLERMSRSYDEKERRLEHEFESLRKRKSIQKNRCRVILICRETTDPYHYQEREKGKASKAEAKHFKSRMIVHPRFRNIAADEAIEMLSDKESGEIIVRPSSRGPSYLTLTLKVYNGVYVHKSIIEGGKENKDIISTLHLGKTLKIGEDVFEDLDELMERYVDPLVSHLKKMLGYRKFKDGEKTQVDESLRKEKIENPSRIVYSFGISHQHPGTFILTYIRSSHLHHEYIGLYPKGFKFRNKMFEEIDRLVTYFQRHINDPHDAAMVD